MKFTLEINMDNAAFEDAADDELGEILRGCASASSSASPPDVQRPLRDSNGNYVGFWKVVSDEATRMVADEPKATIHKGCGGEIAFDAWVGTDGPVFGPYDNGQCQKCDEETPLDTD